MAGGDYIAETKQLLRESPMMAVSVQNLTDEIAELEAVLADESIAAARYGVDAIGGERVNSQRRKPPPRDVRRWSGESLTYVTGSPP